MDIKLAFEHIHAGITYAAGEVITVLKHDAEWLKEFAQGVEVEAEEVVEEVRQFFGKKPE